MTGAEQLAAPIPLRDTSEGARSLARAILSDVRLYNLPKEDPTDWRKPKVWPDLTGELRDGRALFESRVAPELHGVFDAVLREVVEVEGKLPVSALEQAGLVAEPPRAA